ncbi:MAG: ABC transporter ATP-binding protein [Gammaproteobacteria bacterium]
MSQRQGNHRAGTVLEVNNLCVGARDRKGKLTPIVEDVSFAIPAGEVIALIGESGSGKTTISLACMGYARPGCEITGGSIRLRSTQILDLSFRRRRELRGNDIAYIAQSAAAAFNSALDLNRQVTETPVIKGLMSAQEATRKALDLYRELDLPDPETIGGRYPHQVSGGQLQRMMAAMAMICDPALLILDEPTTALDVTTQIKVLRAFKKLILAKHTSAIYVSHDLAVVAQIADNVLVLKDGKAVELGSIEQIINRPQHEYTRKLLGAAHVMPETLPSPRVPRRRAQGASTATMEPLLSVANVTAGYGRHNEHLALRNVSLEAFESTTLGVIGESGSGKTTLGRVIAGLMPAKIGHVELAGQRLANSIDERDREQLRSIQFAFQMADVALNPRHRVRTILARPLEFYFRLGRGAVEQRVSELLELVELPVSYAHRYPRQLSGGERQRVNLARALAAQPQLIVCDEVTSALDTVVAQAILELLLELQNRLKVAYLFISHDISTIARIADTVAVMREGEVVEYGVARDILSPPHHPYTELLLKSVPDLRTDWLDTLELPPNARAITSADLAP